MATSKYVEYAKFEGALGSLGWSQARFAAFVGVGAGTISRWKQAGKAPLWALITLSERLKVKALALGLLDG